MGLEDTVEKSSTIPFAIRNLLTGKIPAGGAVAAFLASIEFILQCWCLS